MAVTAAITLDKSSVTTSPSGTASGSPPPTGTPTPPVLVTMTFTNGSAGSVNVLGIQPTVPLQAPFLLGSPPTGFGQPVTVPGSGTLAISWSIIPLAPTSAPLGSAGQTYAIGATASMSDGSQVVATTSTLTVIGSPSLAQNDANANS